MRDIKGKHCIFGTDEDSLTNIDLILNNRMGLLASEFIGSIVDIDSTVQMFFVLVKCFWKCHKLDDPIVVFLQVLDFRTWVYFFCRKKTW